jgi:hypothetical protein
LTGQRRKLFLPRGGQYWDVIRKTRRNGTATAETKEEKEKRNRDKFQGFHNSEAFKGNCFSGRWDGNIQEYPFADKWKCDEFARKANSHGRLLFFGVQETVFFNDWNGNDSVKPGHFCMESLFFGVQNCFC